jgi:uncharacterized protein
MPDALLTVRVTPRSSREKVELIDDLVRIWVMAAPTDGQANEAVIRILAKHLGIAKSRIELIKGHTSREKTLCIAELSLDEAKAKLGHS